MKPLLHPALLLSLVLAPTAARAAGGQTMGDLASAIEIPQGVEVAATTGRIRITALSSSIFRVRYAPTGEFPRDHSFAVVKGNLGAPPRVQVARTPEAVILDAGAGQVKIYRSPLRLAFLDASGRLLSEDLPWRPAAFSGTSFRVWKSLPENERYYGMGDKAGPLDRREMAFVNWNSDVFGWQESTDPLYKSIPFFLAMRDGRAYGLYLDNTHRSHFDFGKSARGALAFGADDGQLDYYFFAGPHPKRVIEDFTALTGRTPLPPLFSLGYQQCRYSYYPESQVREIATEFRKRKIPADVIYLDIDYQQDNRPFTVDRERFPKFEGMIQDLKEAGFKTVAITDLHLAKLPGYKPYDQGMKGDYFVKNPDGSVYVGKVWPGDSVFPDFTRAEVRKWWGTLYSDFIQIGIRGFWNDMNEPAIFERADKTMPLETVHRVDDGKGVSLASADRDPELANDLRDALSQRPVESGASAPRAAKEPAGRDAGPARGRKTDHREIHNVFGMENARATYEGLLKLSPGVRPFVLTRAAFAGAWRYAASWTGDNSATWNHMRMSVPNLLSLGVSGYALVGDDIGGFAGSPTPELLTRWTQLGAFNPVFRNHAAKGTRMREPWVDGPEHEAIRKRYIEERYRLLPYIYTRMEETSRTGVPLMRPMFLEFPKDGSLAGNGDQFMFGGALLVAPKIVEFSGPYEVRLPEGDWYDYWTGEKRHGGQTISVDPPLDALPVFVRGGTVLPRQPVVQHVGETPLGPLELRVYPGADCRGDVYMDDGETFAYKKGDALRAAFSCDAQPERLDVTLSAPEGSFKPELKSVQVVAYGVSKAREVAIDGKAATQWKLENGRLALPEMLWPAAHTIRITY
ncbi:MAG: glycoside hydrolase family 31 protein [Elusimicrobia bacterium]|nr:glycoside hydrolase family 31 protein [Elusimicrobiota bacterium]